MRGATARDHDDGNDYRGDGSDSATHFGSFRARTGFRYGDRIPQTTCEGDESENLRYQARLRGIPSERVEELLERVGMSRRADEPLRSLSRGMVQRLAVCRTVLHAPELLLLDEPRANLDPAASELVDPLIGAAAQRTRVITSHDPARGLAEADMVLGLRAGRPALLRAAGDVSVAEIAQLYR